MTYPLSSRENELPLRPHFVNQFVNRFAERMPECRDIPPAGKKELCFDRECRMTPAMKNQDNARADRPPFPRLPFTWVMGAQYFLYFGVLGVFLPYFNLYCYHLGFSGFQIGALSAVRSMTLMAFPVLWAVVADRFQARRLIYILCNFTGCGIWLFYLSTTDFPTMFWITLVYGIFFSPIISFLEAFTMDVLGEARNSYGRIRAWGTISFIVTVTAAGRLIDRYSADIILLLIFAGALAQALISFQVPAMRKTRETDLSAGPRFLSNRRAAVFLVCAFLMLASHGTYYGFFSIHLEKLGFDSTFIGIAWALAPLAEMAVMLGSNRVFQRFSLENILIFSFAAATLRWLILYQTRSPVVLLASQLLHAATYGSFHIASILYIDRLAPKEAKTLGQAVNNALTYGLGMMAGFFFNGALYESLGGFALFGISGGIACLGGVIFSGFHLLAPENRKTA